MDVDALLEDPPKLHVDPTTGEPVAWFLDTRVLRHLLSELPADARTAETGAGLSTLVFAAAGYEHTAIAPDAELFDRIGEWCDEHAVVRDRLRLVPECSELWLPRGELSGLDLFLVDGRHGFPSPFIDWYFGATALKVGGLMAVDDTQILTGRILADFLAADRHWDDGIEIGRTHLFRKLDEGVHDDEWGRQEYVRRGSASRPRGLRKLLASFVARTR